MSRTGNYKTAFDRKKAEIHKLKSIFKDLETELKLNALQLKYAKPHHIFPLALKGTVIAIALRCTRVQLKTLESQPLFPKGGIAIAGEGRPETHH